MSLLVNLKGYDNLNFHCLLILVNAAKWRWQFKAMKLIRDK